VYCLANVRTEPSHSVFRRSKFHTFARRTAFLAKLLMASLNSSKHIVEWYLKLGHDRFLPLSFQSVIVVIVIGLAVISAVLLMAS